MRFEEAHEEAEAHEDHNVNILELRIMRVEKLSRHRLLRRVRLISTVTVLCEKAKE